MDIVDSATSEMIHETIGSVPFSITARVVRQFGRESISNSIVAIIELIKNAYDADAETVEIRFAGLDTKKPLLVIKDDGNGMTEQQFRDEWMVIGNNSKHISTKSLKKKRILTGEKGLGRLGLDRLSQKTLVQTFSADENWGVELEIDWSKYENTTRRLETIEHELYRISKLLKDPITGEASEIIKGTILILNGLDDTWAYRIGDKWEYGLLQELKKELSLLVSPFSGVNDFTIKLDSGMGWQDIDGEVGSTDMLRAAEWQILSEIDIKGNISYIMTSPKIKTQFEFPPTPWSQVFPETKVEKPRCGPLRFEMYFIPRRKVNELSLSRAQIESFLNLNQGIRIYRDHFRVRPYGDPEGGEGDWLNLSYRRLQHPSGVAQEDGGRWRVGYNQVVGAIFIERDKNNALIDQTNREGIVEEPAFYDLRRFTLHAIEFFEDKRREYEIAIRKEKDSYQEAQEAVERSSKASSEALEKLEDTVYKVVEFLEKGVTDGQSPNPETTRELLKQVVDNVKETANTVSDTQEAQKQLEKIVERQQAEFQRQKDTLGNLASLGILAATFGHETQASSNLVVSNTNLLKYNVNQLLFIQPPEIGPKINSNVEILDHEARKIETFAKFTLKNIGRDKRQRTKIYLDKIVKAVFISFSKSLEEERGIEIILDYSPEIPAILGFAIDWESIFVNLITNAVWALENTARAERKIRIRIKKIQDRLLVSFADSGRGIEPGTIDRIFMPTFSTRRNDKGDIIGTGMGLAIVQNFVEAHEGTIEVESPCDLGGAQFYIRVPIPNLGTRGRTKEE